MDDWAIFKQISFYVKSYFGYFFWQRLEAIWLLFIPTSSLTGCVWSDRFLSEPRSSVKQADQLNRKILFNLFF